MIVDHTPLIKESRLDLLSLAGKLLSKKIINETDKKEITDTGRLSADERMDCLLNYIKVSIKYEGKVFGDFLEILRDENNVRAENLAKKLEDDFNARQL